jgi:hypothetical protein
LISASNNLWITPLWKAKRLHSWPQAKSKTITRRFKIRKLRIEANRQYVYSYSSTVHLTGNYVPDQEEAEDEMEIPPELAALAARMQAGQDIDAAEYVLNN